MAVVAVATAAGQIATGVTAIVFGHNTFVVAGVAVVAAVVATKNYQMTDATEVDYPGSLNASFYAKQLYGTDLLLCDARYQYTVIRYGTQWDRSLWFDEVGYTRTNTFNTPFSPAY